MGDKWGNEPRKNRWRKGTKGSLFKGNRDILRREAENCPYCPYGWPYLVLTWHRPYHRSGWWSPPGRPWPRPPPHSKSPEGGSGFRWKQQREKTALIKKGNTTKREEEQGEERGGLGENGGESFPYHIWVGLEGTLQGNVGPMPTHQPYEVIVLYGSVREGTGGSWEGE